METESSNLNKEQGNWHGYSGVARSCYTFLCFGLRKEVCLIKDAELQIGLWICLAWHTLYTANHYQYKPSLFHVTDMAGTAL